MRNELIDGEWTTTFRGGARIGERRATQPFGRLVISERTVCLEVGRRFFPERVCIQRQDVDRIEVRTGPSFVPARSIRIRCRVEGGRRQLGFDGPTSQVMAAFVWYGWPVVQRTWWFQEFEPR